MIIIEVNIIFFYSQFEAQIPNNHAHELEEAPALSYIIRCVKKRIKGKQRIESKRSALRSSTTLPCRITYIFGAIFFTEQYDQQGLMRFPWHLHLQELKSSQRLDPL